MSAPPAWLSASVPALFGALILIASASVAADLANAGAGDSTAPSLVLAVGIGGYLVALIQGAEHRREYSRLREDLVELERELGRRP